MAVFTERLTSDTERRTHAGTENTKGGDKPDPATGMLGASLTEAESEKALSDMPALEPYWGKLTVRNLREDRGNVGIIQSPVRASILPDAASRSFRDRGGTDLSAYGPQANALLLECDCGSRQHGGSKF
jgi:hypothetical protein